MVKTRNGNDYGKGTNNDDSNSSPPYRIDIPSTSTNPMDTNTNSNTNTNTIHVNNTTNNNDPNINNPDNTKQRVTTDNNTNINKEPPAPKRVKRRGRRKATKQNLNLHGLKERSIQIQFFDIDNRGACRYSTSCPRCKGVTFAKIQDWRDHHESEHHEQDGYQCPLPECDRNSQNWYNYTNHVQTHDSIAPAWNCIIDGCNLPFANIYSLLSHWKKNHTQYVIRKIPSRSTVADDLRILMGTYEESGGEAAEEQCANMSQNGHVKRRKKASRNKKKVAEKSKKISGRKRTNKNLSHYNPRGIKRQRLNNGKSLRKSARKRNNNVRYNDDDEDEDDEENETEHESDSDFVAENAQITESDSESDTGDDISSESESDKARQDSISSIDDDDDEQESDDSDLYDTDDIDMRDIDHKKRGKRKRKYNKKINTMNATNTTNKSTLESMKILNEIMRDCPKPNMNNDDHKAPNTKKRVDGIDLLLQAVEMMGNKENDHDAENKKHNTPKPEEKVKKEKEKIHKQETKITIKAKTSGTVSAVPVNNIKDSKRLFNVEPIKPSNPLSNNSFQTKLPSLGSSFDTKTYVKHKRNNDNSSSDSHLLSLPNIVANSAAAVRNANNINLMNEQSQTIPAGSNNAQRIQYMTNYVNRNNLLNSIAISQMQRQQQQQQQQQHHHHHHQQQQQSLINGIQLIPNNINNINTINNMNISTSGHTLRHFPSSFINTTAQPKYQAIQVPLNQLNQLTQMQLNGRNQQFAIVQSPNKSMMAVTLVPKTQLSQIPLVLQQNQQQIHTVNQPTAAVLQLNAQHFNNNNCNNNNNSNNNNNNNRINNIQKINTINNINNINNITHINNGAVSINNNNHNNSNDVPDLVDVPELVASNNSTSSMKSNGNKVTVLPLPAIPVLPMHVFNQKK